MNAKPMARVDTVLASAGTGKTTFLAREIVRALAEGLAPERLLATTFTRKAAAELEGRVRDGLSRVDGAAGVRLAGARIGTVNAVCRAICDEFAFELGISPGVKVIDESSARAIFFASAADVLAGYAPALTELSEAFGFAERGIDWRDQLYDVVEAARAAGIVPAELGKSADSSVSGLFDLLPPASNGDDLDAILHHEIEKASTLLSGRSLRVTSRRSEASLRAARAFVSRDEAIPWALWARLSKPDAAKADEAIFAGVARAACRHPEHPRLRSDLERFVRLVMTCASQAMTAFRRSKDARAVIDFGDQETMALAALTNPANLDKLRERIGTVFVDEMQDSSPTQIAIFAALSRVVSRSVWVGDPKQSIFGFRSVDPTLTLAAALGAASTTGGMTRLLSTSWRSRPGICRLVDDCFVPAFERLGLERDQIAFSGDGRGEPDGGDPPLAVWHLEGRTRRTRADAIGSGIAAALAEPERWQVASGSGTRGLRAGDVAVLCRGNDEVEEVASALARSGISVAVERGDLLGSMEGQLVMAAIRWVVDRSDRLALAELVRLSAAPDRQSAWLDALADADPVAALVRELSFAPALDGMRARLASSSVDEIVDAILVEAGVLDQALKWGDGPERMPLLEAMRGLATLYVEECRRARVPGTLGDFARWAPGRGAKVPRTRGADEVSVLTYHRAKGLEWPMVVCTGLDEGPRTSLFEPVVEVEGRADWRDPFAGRWVRFWPWPYGAQAKDVHLDAAARDSWTGRRAARLAREEAIRLLYVGMTRPRDHLVLAAAASREPAWLRVLDTEEAAHVVLPRSGAAEILVAGVSHPVRCVSIEPRTLRERARPVPACLSTLRHRRAFSALRRTPSAATPVKSRILGRVRVGSRMPLRGTPDVTRLGDALHAFLAHDRGDTDPVRRRRMAEDHLARWGMSHHLEPADIVRAADRLHRWIHGRFPGACVRRETAIHAVDGDRTIVGRVDLLIQGDGWVVIVDHKAFPGGRATWDARAKDHAAQLALYAEAVRIVTGAECRGTYVHLPVAGAMIEVGTEAAASSRGTSNGNHRGSSAGTTVARPPRPRSELGRPKPAERRPEGSCHGVRRAST